MKNSVALGAAAVVVVFATLATVVSAQSATAALTADEIQATSEEAFLYGLPLVMLYGIMNEYAINKDSSQFKAPFNTIWNDAAVFTYKDTAVVTPNSDTPYSMVWLDLRAEPMVISVPAVPKEWMYFSPTSFQFSNEIPSLKVAWVAAMNSCYFILSMRR